MRVRARLVDRAGGPAALATISRSEVEEALRSTGGPPALVLDVSRRSARGRPDDSGTVSVDWRREDLEELLRRSDADRLALAFDTDVLESLLEADFEPHGLRRAAAVLAVAVAAGSSAGVASAGPIDANALSRVNAADSAAGASDYVVPPPAAAPVAAAPAQPLELAAEAAMAVGGAGLLISGAAFAMGTRQRPRPA